MSATFKDEVKDGGHICGFCSTNAHDFCKAVIRNGDTSLIKCPCACTSNKIERCTECHTSDPDHLGRPWLCDDRAACDGRVEARLAQSPTYQQIKALRARLDDIKAASREIKLATPKQGGLCLCCGEATRGGNFLPGHDSRWLVNWVERIKNNEITKDAALAEVSKTSTHLAAKLEKRINK